MPGRSKRKNEGGLMGRVAGHALKQVIGGGTGRSRHGRYGGRPSHRLDYDSSDYDDGYSMNSYGAPFMPTSRYSRRASGGPLLSGPFGDQLKWKIGDYIVRKCMNPKSLKAFVPGLKSNDTSDESSDSSSSDLDDRKHARRKPRQSRRKHDEEDSSDSSEDEKRRHRHKPKNSRHRSSNHRDRHSKGQRKSILRSRNPMGINRGHGAMSYPPANSYMPYGPNSAPLPYR